MVKNMSASKLSIKAKDMYAESAARSMEELIARLSEDKEFSSALAKDPRGTLESAGITLEKEAVELLIATDPERFDRACDKLFEILDPDFLAKIVDPSCGTPIVKSQSRYDLKSEPRKR